MTPRPASGSSITPPRGAAIGVLALACALAGCVQPVGPARTAEDYGWSWVLSSLKTLLETGAPLNR
jgi:hypothetical protein